MATATGVATNGGDAAAETGRTTTAANGLGQNAVRACSACLDNPGLCVGDTGRTGVAAHACRAGFAAGAPTADGG